MKYKRELSALILYLCTLVLILTMKNGEYIFKNNKQAEQMQDNLQKKEMKQVLPVMSLYAGCEAEFRIKAMGDVIANKEIFVMAAEQKERQEQEDAIYSFLQGAKSYGERRTWSGEWCQIYVKGNSFAGFGCGICDMANIYSTLSGYECSPSSMYEYARQSSGYSPNKKVGAIGWGDMKVVLKKCGFTCELYTKPDDYESFQEQMKEAKTAVVLVSSDNDNTIWEKSGGHYVNIWLYNEETDEVFLTDPGSPERNRSWIPLEYVYRALKTVSQYQYLLVTDYQEDANEWKQDEILEEWVAP